MYTPARRCYLRDYMRKNREMLKRAFVEKYKAVCAEGGMSPTIFLVKEGLDKFLRMTHRRYTATLWRIQKKIGKQYLIFFCLRFPLCRQRIRVILASIDESPLWGPEFATALDSRGRLINPGPRVVIEYNVYAELGLSASIFSFFTEQRSGQVNLYVIHACDDEEFRRLQYPPLGFDKRLHRELTWLLETPPPLDHDAVCTCWGSEEIIGGPYERERFLTRLLGNNMFYIQLWSALENLHM